MERRQRASNPSSRLTAILSKRPLPGRVKTRLVPPLSPAEAARLAEAMLVDAVERCAASEAFRTCLVHAPAAEDAWFRARFPALHDLRPQRGEELGERLAHFFDDALADPQTTSVVAIGGDQPLVTTRTIARAHELLEGDADLVLGPDGGGGYVLVGLLAPFPELFTEVPMSTAGTCAATVALAEERGLRVGLLPEGLDVDVAADLERLRQELASLPADAPEVPRHTARCLNELLPRSLR